MLYEVLADGNVIANGLAQCEPVLLCTPNLYTMLHTVLHIVLCTAYKFACNFACGKLTIGLGGVTEEGESKREMASGPHTQKRPSLTEFATIVHTKPFSREIIILGVTVIVLFDLFISCRRNAKQIHRSERFRYTSQYSG